MNAVVAFELHVRRLFALVCQTELYKVIEFFVLSRLSREDRQRLDQRRVFRLIPRIFRAGAVETSVWFIPELRLESIRRYIYDLIC